LLDSIAPFAPHADNSSLIRSLAPQFTAVLTETEPPDQKPFSFSKKGIFTMLGSISVSAKAESVGASRV